jgi:hypothetical protein
LELNHAHQQMAVGNADNPTGTAPERKDVNIPAEFIEIQQRLIKDGDMASASDSRKIASPGLYRGIPRTW